jgi:plastocyanin
VVYFEDVPADPGQIVPMRGRMNQTDETFVPHLLALTIGSTVDFPNDDNTYHNVFSLSKPKKFDLGRYATGRSKSVTFDRPGIVRVFCEIHSHMNAFILVFAHRFFAVTDQNGRYRIDQIPPGTYRVTAWYEGIALETERVTIPAGATVDLDFRLRQ